MKLEFTKMQGAGNDYIYINGFETTLSQDTATRLAHQLSNRNFGIGADGLVIIDPVDGADAKMRMYNADGSEGKMCGNAIRCVAKYIYDHGIVTKEKVVIDTVSGKKAIDLVIENNFVSEATVDMGAANFVLSEIPVKSAEAEWIDYTFTTSIGDYQVTAVSMGNPHLVTFLDEIHDLNLTVIGPVFEHHPAFPERINTEFVVVHSPTELSMRVWERGSGETMACGTGACAVVAAAVRNGHSSAGEWITVHLLGGDLAILYNDETVLMRGPAVEVYKGSIELVV